MTDPKDPRTGRVHIETARICDRCGDPYVGNKSCPATVFESECVPRPEAPAVDRDAPTMTDCAYCSGSGKCPGCNGARMVDTGVKSSQLEHPIDQAAQTRKKL